MASERELVKKITRALYAKKNVLVKAGEDDAAVVKIGGKRIVFTTDIGFRATHFPKQMSYREIGFKTICVNLSDLAATGAKPECALASIGITKQMKAKEVEELARGMNEACKKYNASLVGGDTKKAKELTVSICAVGEMLEGSKILQRNNARAGDVVCVTGEIGNAACGLDAMLKEKNKEKRRKNEYTKLVLSFTRPIPRVREALILSKECERCAAIDSSDGLLFTLKEIAEASRVKIRIEKNKIPVSREAREYAREKKMNEKYLLDTGEDYELAVCMSKKDFEKVKKKVKLIEVGRVEKGRGLETNGKKTETKGYDAFLA